MLMYTKTIYRCLHWEETETLFRTSTVMSMIYPPLISYWTTAEDLFIFHAGY